MDKRTERIVQEHNKKIRISKDILTSLNRAERWVSHTALKMEVMGEWDIKGFDPFDQALGYLLGHKRILRSAVGKGMRYKIRPKEEG